SVLAEAALTPWKKWGAILAWRIEFDEKAKKELAALDKTIAKRITAFLRSTLTGRGESVGWCVCLLPWWQLKKCAIVWPRQRLIEHCKELLLGILPALDFGQDQRADENLPSSICLAILTCFNRSPAGLDHFLSSFCFFELLLQPFDPLIQ
ncbi:hypothetical protein FCL39_022860, partial [Enterobacter hormaechei]|uniref:type II toxin-antitoxin system RelE family toxin n=1 Tax=Enterobacter hormaechei TaxID=158836 RepID=UPI0024AE0247